jgi:hypothetical protein
MLCYNRTHLEGPDHPVLAHPGGRLPTGEQEQGQHLQVSSLQFYLHLEPNKWSSFRIRALKYDVSLTICTKSIKIYQGYLVTTEESRVSLEP